MICTFMSTYQGLFFSLNTLVRFSLAPQRVFSRFLCVTLWLLVGILTRNEKLRGETGVRKVL